ncbi:MAG: tetratricopeptide repeat protein [bacterium]
MKVVTFLTVLAFPLWSWPHGPLVEQIANKTKEIQANPSDAILYLERGELYRYHEDWDKALADYDTALTLNRELSIVDLARGKMFYDAGLFEESVEPLERFLQKYPEHADALLVRARSRFKIGQNLKAAEDFSKTIKLSATPKPEYYIGRAKALVAAGPEYLDQAVLGLDEGLDLMGQIVTLQLYAIELEVARENYDGALARLQKISAQSARKEKWLKRQGEILLKAGRVEEARRVFEQALQEIDAFSLRRRKTKWILKLENWLRNTLDHLDENRNSRKGDGK